MQLVASMGTTITAVAAMDASLHALSMQICKGVLHSAEMLDAHLKFAQRRYVRIDTVRMRAWAPKHRGSG